MASAVDTRVERQLRGGGKLGDRKQRVAGVAWWQGLVYRVQSFLGLAHHIFERVQRLAHDRKAFCTNSYTPKRHTQRHTLCPNDEWTQSNPIKTEWLELRRLPPIMGWVLWGQGQGCFDPSCLELR